jgi:hypothetical protein
MKSIGIVTGAAITILASSDVAADMPRYDAEAHCEEVAAFGGERSAMLYNSCVDMEQSAYNGLKEVWQTLPAATQSHCNDVASFGSPGSYTLLESCVDMETNAANNQSEFSFD